MLMHINTASYISVIFSYNEIKDFICYHKHDFCFKFYSVDLELFVSRPIITHPAHIYVTVKVIFDIQIKLRIIFYLVHLTSRGLFHAKFSDETHIRTRKHPCLPLMYNIYSMLLLKAIFTAQLETPSK